MARVLVPLADGVEEMEAVIVIDTFRRAGWAVVAAAVRSPPDALPAPLTASRGVRLVADAEWDAVHFDLFDILVFPGGAGGTRVLRADPRLLEAAQTFFAAGKWVCAICAAPLILQSAGILKGRRATCHPAVRKELAEATLCEERVVVDGRLVTSQGPGTTFEFALAIIRLVDGADAETKVREGLIL